MIHLLIRPIFALVLLFAGLVGAIHAQPYDDSQLRAFLTPPEGCPTPCFMGIRPGVTTIEEAALLLTTDDWVGELTFLYNRYGRMNQAQWTWSGLQPNFIDGSKQAFVVAPDGVITMIGAETVIPYGSLLLTLGAPDRGATELSDRGSAFIFNNVGYLSRSLGVRSIMGCPARLTDIFETKVSISFIADMDALFGGGDYRQADWDNVHPCA